jgi:glyoxylase-like metal-dependent hydrolase (beta-lactamase superfamily II)
MFTRNHRYPISALLFVFLAFSLTVNASTISILPAPEKVSDHVYAWIGPYGGPNPDNQGFRMNMGFVVGKDAVLVFDTGFYPDMAREMIKHIRTISQAPIKYAVNSNSQPDRYFGNSAFDEIGAELIAHEKEVARMQEQLSNHYMFLETSMKFKDRNIPLPKLPATQLKAARDIDLGGVTVKISFHKAAHTPMPLILHITPDNVVYAGDILYSGRILAVVPGGNIRQWIETFEHLRTFSDATFVPGHGRPAALKDFESSTLFYLKLLDGHMTDMVEAGMDMQDAIDKLDQSAYSNLENYQDLAGRNANMAFQEAERASFE